MRLIQRAQTVVIDGLLVSVLHQFVGYSLQNRFVANGAAHDVRWRVAGTKTGDFHAARVIANHGFARFAYSFGRDFNFQCDQAAFAFFDLHVI